MIRAWKAEDLAEIAAIEKASFTDPWSESMLEFCLQSPSYRGFVADEGCVAGYAAYTGLDDAEIVLIAVAGEYRRRGLGEALMKAMLESARADGCKKAVLEVRVSNAVARACYEKLGFEYLYIRRRYYADGEDALVMVKNLSK